MELGEVYKQIILEIKNNLKYYNEDDIDFIFDENDSSRFKFLDLNNRIEDKLITNDIDEFNLTLNNQKISNNIDKNNKTINIKPKVIASKESRMAKINAQVMNCKRCPLHRVRNNTVFGEGNLNAEIMFIGEGPGENEDLTGRPFVGKAGELLVRIIENVLKLKREDVYMANIVKCRPPGNRNPNNLEVSGCINYLHEQIKIIRPKIIVPLGNVALSTLLPRYSGITRNRGREMKLILSREDIFDVIPTYHPSYLLRGSQAEIRQKKLEVWEDIKKIMQKLNMLI